MLSYYYVIMKSHYLQFSLKLLMEGCLQHEEWIIRVDLGQVREHSETSVEQTSATVTPLRILNDDCNIKYYFIFECKLTLLREVAFKKTFCINFCINCHKGLDFSCKPL